MSNILYAKIDRLAKKINSSKNTTKSPIFLCTYLGYQTFEGPGQQTVDTRSTWGYDSSK